MPKRRLWANSPKEPQQQALDNDYDGRTDVAPETCVACPPPTIFHQVRRVRTFESLQPV